MGDRFNEGLEQGIKFGEERERERIIKLLDQELASGFAKAFVIGLIKGEDVHRVKGEN
jgi:hypothetical protein